jgi:3-dehydroquinate dehydratase-2
MRLAVLNGPNLNLLGQREPEIYGRTTLPEIEVMLRADAEVLGVELEWLQTNHEGELIDAVQALAGRVHGAVINAGALTHTSLGLRDALLAVQVPFVEVHLSNLFAREAARRHSHIADLAVGFICGFGADGYRMALRALAGRLQ